MNDRLENRLFRAFHRLFESNLQSCNFNHRDTFEKTNQEFSSGFMPFASYESFKNSKSRHLKKRNKYR